MCNDGCTRRCLQRSTWRNHRPPWSIFTMEELHISAIPGTRSKVSAINTASLSPPWWHVLLPLSLASQFPHQRLTLTQPNHPMSKQQGISLLPNSGPHSNSNLVTQFPSSKVDPPQYDKPIAHRNRSCAPIPPPDNKPVSQQMLYVQGLANLSDAVLYSSAASCHRLSNSSISKWALPVYGPESGKALENRQLFIRLRFKEDWDQSYPNDLGRLF